MWWPKAKKNCPFIEIHYSRKRKGSYRVEEIEVHPFFRHELPRQEHDFFHETVIIIQKSACISKKIFRQYNTFKCFQNSSIMATRRGDVICLDFSSLTKANPSQTLKVLFTSREKGEERREGVIKRVFKNNTSKRQC